MSRQEVARYLMDRADSYWRDARALEEDGDRPMAQAFYAVARTLREVVVEIAEGSDA